MFNHIYEPFAGCSHEINCHEYVNDKFYNCHDLIIPLTGIDWSAVESACGKNYQLVRKVFPKGGDLYIVDSLSKCTAYLKVIARCNVVLRIELALH